MRKDKKETDKKNKLLTKNISLMISSKYISFKMRILLYTILFVVFILSSIYLFFNSFAYQQEKSTKYQENSNLDYKVYLKPNEFYETEYLGKNMIYVASLIKSISIDFNYQFAIADPVNMDFVYSIVGKLNIADDSGSVFFEKEYILLDSKENQVNDSLSYDISENIVIDYDYYNKLANDFKMAYGVEANSSLTVYLKISKQISDSKKEINLNQDNNMSIVIPLSQKTVDINMNYTEINSSNYISSSSEFVVSNALFIVLSIIGIVISFVMLSSLFKLLATLIPKKNAFDKYVNKLLSEYDRLIVETQTAPVLDKYTVIKINKFQELLDVRDNLKLPIMYYVLVKHQKGYFFIRHNDELYLFIVKAVDLENQKVQK